MALKRPISPLASVGTRVLNLTQSGTYLPILRAAIMQEILAKVQNTTNLTKSKMADKSSERVRDRG